MQSNVIRIASAILLLTATACGDDDDNGPDERDAAMQEAGRPDAGGDAAADARVKPDADTMDAGDEEDSSVDEDASVDDAGDLDAAPDAELEDAASSIGDAGDAGGANDAGDAMAMNTDDGGLPTLAAWYKFDENAGTTSVDSTGTMLNATLQNGATWTAGRAGSALLLTGGAPGTDSPHASLPAQLLDGCQDVTVALWMRLGAVTNWSRLLDVDGLSNGFLFFTPAAGPGMLRFNIYYAGLPEGQRDQGVTAAYPEGTQLVDTWHHVAFTLTGGIGRLYFDGDEIGQNPMNATPMDLDYAAGAHAWIGRTTFPDPFLNGAVDDLRISCSAYSAQQIEQLAR